MTLSLNQEQCAKILTPGVQRLFIALDGTVRIVGGAVRDVLLNRKIGDIDLATTLPPERVMEILATQHIKTVPTGLAHGTITAVVDHVGHEITTLRRDVSTDGRHATVTFTDDWRADAARRDFTFNALYVDAEGTLYDYFNGSADATAGRVRFIGDARARIREDVLRILRFFRFSAFFGQGAPDEEALAACRELGGLIPNLSAERIARETIKLLTAPDPAHAWQLMCDSGVTSWFAAEATDLARLQKLVANEKKFNESPSALTRLAALLPPEEKCAEAIAARLKLSNREGEKLCVLAKLPALLKRMSLREALYTFGIENSRAAVFLNGENIADSLAVIGAWDNPVFPLKGEDLVKLGLTAGPRIGEILRAVESWWIADDFRADKPACLAQARICGKFP